RLSFTPPTRRRLALLSRARLPLVEQDTRNPLDMAQRLIETQSCGKQPGERTAQRGVESEADVRNVFRRDAIEKAVEHLCVCAIHLIDRCFRLRVSGSQQLKHQRGHLGVAVK